MINIQKLHSIERTLGIFKPNTQFYERLIGVEQSLGCNNSGHIDVQDRWENICMTFTLRNYKCDVDPSSCQSSANLEKI